MRCLGLTAPPMMLGRPLPEMEPGMEHRSPGKDEREASSTYPHREEAQGSDPATR